MANINRYSPGRLSPWDRDWFDEMERAFSEPYFGRRGQGDRDWGLPLDVSEREDRYVVRASIPGINPDDVDLSISDNVLTIRGSLTQSADDQSENYVLRERRLGNFTRSVTFPMAIDANKAEASCEHGVLTISLPKAETARPRRINIGGGAPGRQTIDATATSGAAMAGGNVATSRPDGGQTAGGTVTGSNSEGWPEGQARPGRPSTERNREGQTWTEGQSPTNVPQSGGWTEGQSENWDEKTRHSEGWTEGMEESQR